MKKFLVITLFSILATFKVSAQNWGISLSPTDETCAGANDGKINLTITGSATGTYTWTIFESADLVVPYATGTYGTDQIDGLFPDEWTVEVTRNGTETKSGTATVEGSEDPLIISLPTVLQQNLCNSDASASVQATASDGSGDYLYGLGVGAGITYPSYTGGYEDNNGTFSSLPANTYSIWAKDERGCIVSTGDFVLSAPNSISIEYDTINANCNNIGGQITITSVSGGTPFAPGDAGDFNMQIQWYDDEGTELTAFENDATITGLDSGQYTVIITDKNGCTNGSGQTFDIFDGFNFAVNSQQNVTCKDDNDGQITIRLDTDTQDDESPFQLRIYDGNGTEIAGKRQNGVAVGATTFTGLGPDTYTIIAESATGCERDVEVEITEPDAPQLDDAEPTHVICKGESTGVIELSGSGGSGTILFSIMGDAVAPGGDWNSSTTRESLPAGTYHIWITDDNIASCQTYEATVEITEPDKKWGIVKKTEQQITCNGESDGIAEFEYDGSLDVTDLPIEDEDIIWRDGSGNILSHHTGSLFADNLDEGDYTVTVTDFYGCPKTLSYTITENPALKINATTPMIECPLSQGGGTATIDASTTSGGDGNYTFKWYEGASVRPETTNTLNITTNGSYRLEVTDGKGCKAYKTFDVTIPDDIVVSTTQVNVSCLDGNDGSIKVEISGGTPNYGYSWVKDGNPFSITKNLSGLEAGVYELTVTDDNECGPPIKTVTITEPTTTFTLSGTKTDVICAGDDNGEINLTISNTGHTYTTSSIIWTKDGEALNEWADSTNLTDLAPGAYEATVTDGNGCAKTASWTIINQNTLTLSPVVTQNDCKGYTNGQIQINPQGGSSNSYTIEWKKGASVIANNVNAISGLSDGTYRVTVTDPIGCKVTREFVLQAPEDITATVEKAGIACKGDVTGEIILAISGGTEPYTITWEKSGEVLPHSSASIYGLTPGTYDVTVEDDNSCTPFTASYTITEPSTEYDISLQPLEIGCHNANTAELEVVLDAEAGHPDSYTVKWFKNGGTTSIFTQTTVSASAITAVTGLNAADYTVEVTDNNGCVRTASYTMQNPSKIIFNPDVTPVSCYGFEDGSISLNPSGGYGNFTYAWKFNGSTISNTQSFLNNLKAGKYSISMTDAGGCVVDTTINMQDPLPIEVDATVDGPKCTHGSDGSITIGITNGTPPYQFEWWQNDNRISLEQNLTDLSEGTYMLIVTDQVQCEIDTLVYTVSDPPSDFSITGSISKVTCHGHVDGSIDIDVVVTGNPDLDYSVLWEKDGAQFSQNTEDLHGIGAGTYEIFVTDEYGCIKSKTFSLENPNPIELIFDIKDVSCYQETDGSVSVQVTGGYGDYTYAWQKDGEPFNVTGSFANNLEAGFYRLSITDGEGCVESQTVEVVQPAPFLIEVNKKNNTCSSPYDSEISADITGGVKPYNLQWFRNGLPYSKDEDLSGIPSGTYYLLATDTNFCETTSAEVVINTPDPLGIEIISIKDNLCPNTNNGAISFQGTGGFFPYTYSFDTSAYASKNNFVNLDDDDYLISIRDNSGCTFDTVITIGNVHHLEAEFSMQTDEFAIDFPIALTDESLGDNIVEWFWDFGDTRASADQNSTVTYTEEGTYVITLLVENEVGCRLSKSDTVEITRGYNFTIPTAFTPNNDSYNDTFRPAFQNVESMNMKVQDRNGILVFETNELSESWDGTFKGIPAPQGSYYFEVTFTARSGKIRKEKGKVFLLR